MTQCHKLMHGQQAIQSNPEQRTERPPMQATHIQRTSVFLVDIDNTALSFQYICSTPHNDINVAVVLRLLHILRHLHTSGAVRLSHRLPSLVRHLSKFGQTNMNEASRPAGLELLLSGVPYGMSDRALKRRIEPLLKIQYEFLVVLTKYSEDLFWESFSDRNVTNTARIIIPDTDRQHGDNPGSELLRRSEFSIGYKKKVYRLKVMNAQNHETTSDKFVELRNTKLILMHAVKAVRDGVLGDISTISCGNFDHNNHFETTYKWLPNHGSSFNKFSYYGDAFPKKFQVCLTESGPGKPFKWEWMDLHESNIRGMIFEHPKPQSPKRRGIYFVVDKPPQFYQRTQVDNDQAGDGKTRYVTTRISHPSVTMQAPPGNSDICDVVGVPWVIQYSRVFKVEYEHRKELTLTSYEQRLSQTQKDNLISFHYPNIEQSGRTVEEMILTLCNNLEYAKNVIGGVLHAPLDFPIAVLKLFYNCNLCPLLEETTSARERLPEILRDGVPSYDWEYLRTFVDALQRSSQVMETSHLRALRRLHASPSANPKIPQRPVQPPVEPAEALSQQMTSEVLGRVPLIPYPSEVFVVLVYPSHVQIQGPVAQGPNSVIEEHRAKIGRFIRIRFVDNNEKPFRMEAGISPDSIINNRIVKVLLNNLQPFRPIGQRFEFLGYSVSGLKKKKAVWFFRDDNDGLRAETIRARIGNWDVKDELANCLAEKPSKWGARVALAFTESYPVVTLFEHEWTYRKDEGDDKDFPNTDGCGLISAELCRDINQRLVPLGFNVCSSVNDSNHDTNFIFQESQAFQIRFGGVKGVVYSGVQSLLDPPHGPKEHLKMLLRKSQVKFNTPSSVWTSGNLTLRIASTAGDGCSSLFFAPLIKALEDSGVKTTKIEEIYLRTYEELTKMSCGGLDTLQELCRVSDKESDTDLHARYILLQLAIRLKRYNIFPENYARSFLKLYLIKLAERANAKNLFEIPIPDSCQALGLTDDYQILGEKEVYVRAKGLTVTGEVLIYRDPIIHIGDIQKATAITDGTVCSRLSDEHSLALTNMNNVIFFSQRDNPPLPNLLSGGDLDGDRFEILKVSEQSDSWLHGFNPSPHNNYTNEGTPHNDYIDDGTRKKQSKMKDFDIDELAKFIGQYIRNDCFAELQDIHMCLADEKAKGMKHPDVVDLANWLSQAVDYAKSGVKVDLYENIVNTERFRVSAKPDLLRGLNRKAFYDSKGEYYQSSNVLGKIYRRISGLKYDIPDPIDDSTLRTAISGQWNFQNFNPTEDEKQVFGDYLEHLLITSFNMYCHYLEAHNISQQSEIDIFLRKRQDDFPKSQLTELSAIVMIYLNYRHGPIKRSSYQLSDPNREFLEKLYKNYLFRAW